MPNDDTLARMPRPPDLWRAWHSTIEYITLHTGQPTTLHLIWNSHGMDAPWLAQLNWAANNVQVRGKPSPGVVLEQLWTDINATYKIFKNRNHARIAPQSYDPAHWFTSTEQAILDRLVELANTQATTPSTLLITSQISLEGQTTIQARLLRHVEGITITSEGSALLSVCQELYPKAVARFEGGQQ